VTGKGIFWGRNPCTLYALITTHHYQTLQMSAELYTLPDDLLRALAAFAPLSGLLALVECSRRFATALRSIINHRLDNLFILLPKDCLNACKVETRQLSLGSSLSRREVRNTFGEPEPSQWGTFCYLFAEGPKGYDGLSSALKLITTGYGCYIFCQNRAVGNRLIGCLHRRHTQSPLPQDLRLHIRIR
jgi:hypothetical protein